jgi:hypothetical protein
MKSKKNKQWNRKSENKKRRRHEGLTCVDKNKSNMRWEEDVAIKHNSR